MSAKIVKKDKTWVYFSMESISQIDPESAMLKQAALGYLPAGYGFSEFKVRQDPVLMRFLATWQCYASCD
jgi:hypothetical protein